MNLFTETRSRVFIFLLTTMLIGGAIAYIATRPTGFQPTHQLRVGAEHAYEFFAPATDLQCEVSHSPALGTYAYCQSVSHNRSVRMEEDGTFKTCENGSCLGNPGLGTGTLSAGTRVIDGPLTCDLTADNVSCYNQSNRGFVASPTSLASYK
jgi:hypothetical protein